MSIKLEKTTNGTKTLKIISVVDSAIDWDESYPNPEDLQDELEEEKQHDVNELPNINTSDSVELSLEKRKKAHYERHHDESKLRFKQDDAPTLFVFAHPHRVDVARKMREIAANMYADTQRGKKDKVDRDMFTAVFHHFYLGTEQGFGGTREVAQRINGRMTDDLIQALEDAEVFIELNSAFMRVYNQDRTKLRDKNHSEK